MNHSCPRRPCAEEGRQTVLVNMGDPGYPLPSLHLRRGGASCLRALCSRELDSSAWHMSHVLMCLTRLHASHGNAPIKAGVDCQLDPRVLNELPEGEGCFRFCLQESHVEPGQPQL